MRVWVGRLQIQNPTRNQGFHTPRGRVSASLLLSAFYAYRSTKSTGLPSAKSSPASLSASIIRRAAIVDEKPREHRTRGWRIVQPTLTHRPVMIPTADRTHDSRTNIGKVRKRCVVHLDARRKRASSRRTSHHHNANPPHKCSKRPREPTRQIPIRLAPFPSTQKCTRRGCPSISKCG